MEWISVKDRLPKEGEDVLVFVQEKVNEDFTCTSMFVGWYDDIWFICQVRSYSKVDGQNSIVTHWMPLPEPPKEQE